MTGGLVAAVAVTSVLGLGNLLLTYGVVRRLREHERRLTPGRSAPSGPALGAAMPAFTATTTAGTTMTDRMLLTGDAWIGFFSPGCAPCRQQLPAVGEAAGAVGRDRTLVVIGRDGADPEVFASFVARAETVGHVVVEDLVGPLAAAFAVNGRPTLLRFADGVLAASGHDVDAVAARQPAGEEAPAAGEEMSAAGEEAPAAGEEAPAAGEEVLAAR